MVKFLAALVLLAGACGAPTQTKDFTTRIKFHDGGVLTAKVKPVNIVVATKYGTLTIPLSAVQKIEFGQHVPDELYSRIQLAISKLAVEDYRVREAATTELLKVGHWAFRQVRTAAAGKDIELSRRCGLIVKTLQTRYPDAFLLRKEKDTVYTSLFDIVGDIQNRTFDVSHASLGEKALPIYELKELAMFPLNVTLSVSAGSPQSIGIWVDVLAVPENVRLTIEATGTIDLYPLTPGICLTGPDGSGQKSGDNPFTCGTLKGRFGLGEAFFVGEKYTTTLAAGGDLSLHVEAGIWNECSPTGRYRVVVRVEPLELGYQGR